MMAPPVALDAEALDTLGRALADLLATCHQAAGREDGDATSGKDVATEVEVRRGRIESPA